MTVMKSRSADRAVAAFARACLADDRKALFEAAADAFVDYVRERWRERLHAADALLNAAGIALDRAEASDNPRERRRQLELFELCMAAACAPAVTEATNS
jgi:NAD(P)-dependent dehydrogenase (short-subunit alcohol dehydrogenase family)